MIPEEKNLHRLIKYYYHCTCSAMPEQYDVYTSLEDFQKKKEPIAYIRLRFGNLKCEVPFNGVGVYTHTFEDKHYGYMSETERNFHLHQIDNAIYEHLNRI